MRETVHRNAPTGAVPRIALALLATVFGVPLFLWGVVALLVNVLWGAVILLPVGGVLAAVGYHLARGVAEQAAAAPREANPARSVGEETVEDDPVEVLQDRYARGELDEEEFDRRMDRLLESDRRREEAEPVDAEKALE